MFSYLNYHVTCIFIQKHLNFEPSLLIDIGVKLEDMDITGTCYVVPILPSLLYSLLLDQHAI